MEIYVIAEPNGAGKTTFAREFLPNYADCRNFVNADLIAQGMAPFSPETAALRAGRLMLEEIRAFAKRGISFGFESTLSGRSYVPLLRELKSQGTRFTCSFCGSRTGARNITGTGSSFERRARYSRTSDSPSLRSVDPKLPDVLSPDRGCVDAVWQLWRGAKSDRFGGEWDSSYNR